MKTNTMRAPLYKAGAVILVMALLAYLTSASGGGVLDSVGQLIIGAFRLVQWAIAMTIGIAVCIAADGGEVRSQSARTSALRGRSLSTAGSDTD